MNVLPGDLPANEQTLSPANEAAIIERQEWAVETIGATLTDGQSLSLGGFPVKQGPTCIPYLPFGGTSAEGDGLGRGDRFPNDPAIYGRYLVIDLDANNRASRDAYHEDYPDREQSSFGYGVCRHGFGLQSFGDGYMSKEVATARAIRLNAGGMATDVVNDSGLAPQLERA